MARWQGGCDVCILPLPRTNPPILTSNYRNKIQNDPSLVHVSQHVTLLDKNSCKISFFFHFVYKIVFRTLFFPEGCKRNSICLSLSFSVHGNGTYINAVMGDFRWMTEGGQCSIEEVATE